MRIIAVTMMAVLAGAGGWAGESLPAAEPKVIVCMTLGQASGESSRAYGIATKMFANIGVQVEWHRDGPSCTANGVIVIKLTDNTPRGYHPRALAFAQPYEGVHIQVFYDRIKESVKPPTVPCLLAHVLVHEITHILEGIHRHSESGVMKASWSHEDLWAMAWKPFVFAEHDVHLIHRGLEGRRAAKPTDLDPAPATVATQ